MPALKSFGLWLARFEKMKQKPPNSLDFDCTWYFHLRVNTRHHPSVLFDIVIVPHAEADPYFARPEVYTILESFVRKRIENYPTFPNFL